MRTLTIRAHDFDGRRDNGDLVQIVNVDDQRIYSAYAVMHDGTAKFSVPIGNYMADIDFAARYPDLTLREVIRPQFSVTADRTIVMDARTADRRFSVRTPQPASSRVQAAVVARSDARGKLISAVAVGARSYHPYFVNPTRTRVSIGEFHFYLNVRLFRRRPPPRRTPTIWRFPLTVRLRRTRTTSFMPTISPLSTRPTRSCHRARARWTREFRGR